MHYISFRFLIEYLLLCLKISIILILKQTLVFGIVKADSTPKSKMCFKDLIHIEGYT